MKKISTQIFSSVLLFLLINTFTACSSDGSSIPQDTFIINGVEHSCTHVGYIKNNNNLTLYFGNNEYGCATKSIHITIAADKPKEDNYYFHAPDNAKNTISSASYINANEVGATEIKELNKGSVSLIQFENAFIINYELEMTGHIISGHHIRVIPQLNAE